MPATTTDSDAQPVAPAIGALTGCDLQPVADVAGALAALGRRYTDRVYTPTEVAEAGGAAGLAARFAGKEAVMKLIGTTEGVELRTIEILRSASGRPTVVLTGPIAEAARARGIEAIDLSLSHTDVMAMAVAVAVLHPGGTP